MFLPMNSINVIAPYMHHGMWVTAGSRMDNSPQRQAMHVLDSGDCNDTAHSLRSRETNSRSFLREVCVSHPSYQRPQGAGAIYQKRPMKAPRASFGSSSTIHRCRLSQRRMVPRAAVYWRQFHLLPEFKDCARPFW
jgi:hypothetical protein